MRAQEFITESIHADQVLDYVNRLHHDFDIEYSITDHPKWQLKNIPLRQLHLDPDGEAQDPYNRVNWVDYDKVRDLVPKIGSVLKSSPIVVDSQGWIIDGNHRAAAAVEAGLDKIPAYVPVKSTVAEGLTEAREGAMREIIRKALPSWPDYVIKDWISSRIKNQEDLKNLTAWLGELNKMVEPNSWKLHQKMFLTFDMLSPKTRYFMKIKRNFGEKNPFLIPRDEERSANAEQLVKTQGMENLPPVIMLQHANGLELCEGWHRTMAAFRLHPDGFYINAWIGQAGKNQGVAENMDHSQDGRAVEELKSALLAKRDQLQSATDDQVYDIIDKIMTRIARSHSISGQKLHDMWVDKYKQIPDTWIMNENFADGKVRGKSRPGRVKRAGASCAGSVTDLRAKAKKYGGERGKMYHWCANMKGGKK